jgi:hypothetical protein
VFNWSEVHFFGSTSYEIHTLAEFPDCNVWHLQIWTILLHTVVFHSWILRIYLWLASAVSNFQLKQCSIFNSFLACLDRNQVCGACCSTKTELRTYCPNLYIIQTKKKQLDLMIRSPISSFLKQIVSIVLFIMLLLLPFFGYGLVFLFFLPST